MDKQRVASELLKIAKELSAGLDSGINKEMQKLLKKVQSGKGLAPSAFADHTDGELMAMLLLPVMQNMTVLLKDGNGFRKRVKIKEKVTMDKIKIASELLKMAKALAGSGRPKTKINFLKYDKDKKTIAVDKKKLIAFLVTWGNVRGNTFMPGRNVVGVYFEIDKDKWESDLEEVLRKSRMIDYVSFPTHKPMLITLAYPTYR